MGLTAAGSPTGVGGGSGRGMGIGGGGSVIGGRRDGSDGGTGGIPGGGWGVGPCAFMLMKLRLDEGGGETSRTGFLLEWLCRCARIYSGTVHLCRYDRGNAPSPRLSALKQC